MKNEASIVSDSGKAKRGLYGAAKLLAAPPDKPVFIVEGRKEAKHLRSLGLVATTKLDETKEWRTEDSELLRGRAVVFLPNNDKSGREGAEKVAGSLDGVATSIKIIELPSLPPGESVSDWLKEGRTRDDLEEVVEETPEWQPVPDLGTLLLGEASAFLRRFVVFASPHQVTAVALWVAHTHAIDATEATPYLGITAPEKRSGKTRLLEALELLVARPWRAILPSEAVMFRKIDADQPTLLFDEVDAVFKDKSGAYEVHRAMMNAGHRRGAVIPRCQGETMQVRDFQVFGPKAIAGIGNLPDTVADRCIPIRLVRRAANEPVQPFRYLQAAREAAPLRKGLARWAQSAVDALRAATPDIPDALNDRAADGWEPLFAIADAAGGDWPRLAREAAVALHCDPLAWDESTGIALLRAIYKIFKKRAVDRIPTEDLITALVKRSDGPWAEWWEEKVNNGNTKGPGARLSRLLRPYGIRPKPIRVGGKVTKGYERTGFKDAFRRYLSHGPKEVTRLQNTQTPSDRMGSRADRDTTGGSPLDDPRNLVTSSGPLEGGRDKGDPGETNGLAKPSLHERIRRGAGMP